MSFRPLFPHQAAGGRVRCMGEVVTPQISFGITHLQEPTVGNALTVSTNSAECGENDQPVLSSVFVLIAGEPVFFQ